MMRLSSGSGLLAAWMYSGCTYSTESSSGMTSKLPRSTCDPC